jgi:hypothetical protein
VTSIRPAGGMSVDLPSFPEAACAGRWDYFFAEDGEGCRRTRRRVARAKEICATCLVAAECLSFALTSGIAEGVWGGLTEDERKHMRRRQADAARRAA